MNKLQSILLFSLLVSGNTAFANRPAEDDPAPAYQPPVEEQQSNIPAPDNSYSSDIPEAPEVTEQTQQTGDIVEIPAEASQSQVILFDFPRRGMDMSKVLNEMGEPTTRHSPIGQPPITRWDYPDRSVFFEYSHVIHVVAR